MKLLNDSQIKQIFKGDQNLFWDALITDSALAYRLNIENSSIQFTPFIHDEKFGAPDQNLIHCLEKPIDSFFISEDYADSAGDATYLNLDVSFGIFYFPVVEESRLKDFKISIKSISRAFAKVSIDMDEDFIKKCSKFGLFLNFAYSSDQGSTIIPNQEELDCFFDIHPEQRIFYIFTRAIGRFGIAPIKDNNVLLSSVYLKDSNMKETLKTLFMKYLLEGIYQQTDSAEHETIKNRFDEVWKQLIQNETDNVSIADMEKNISIHILKKMKPDFNFNLTKSSHILTFPTNYQINHFYLESFIQQSNRMSESYNKSLNQTKMSIQRIQNSEHLTNLPFYVNYKNDEGRFIRSELVLNIKTKELLYKKQNDFIKFKKSDSSFISGKAIPFLNEFRLNPSMIALPEHGSKYTPACDAFIINSRLDNIQIPKAQILRISVHFLDQLNFLDKKILTLPKLLIPFFGQNITCKDFSIKWREVIDEIESVLNIMKEQVSDGKETVIARTLFPDDLTPANLNNTYAKFMNSDMFNLLKELIEELKLVLKERLKKVKSTILEKKYRIVSFKIKLIIRYYMQQLIQVHDGLIYLNDRPYSLAIYLMFGEYFLEELIKNVTFRVETL